MTKTAIETRVQTDLEFFDLKRFKKSGAYNHDDFFGAIEHLMNGCDKLSLSELGKANRRVWILSNLDGKLLLNSDGVLEFDLREGILANCSKQKIHCIDLRGKINKYSNVRPLLTNPYLIEGSNLCVYGVLHRVSGEPFIDTFVIEPSEPSSRDDTKEMYGPSAALEIQLLE